jgi:UDP-glucuronate 4-epimerase
MTEKRCILITGTAGFIGFHTAKRLLEAGDSVVGIDNVNDYYDVTLKQARLRDLEQTGKRSKGTWTFIRGDLADVDVVDHTFMSHRFERVIHLAAQAGVRHSLSHPRAYVQSNIVAFTNILEACRHNAVPHLTYASTSSVYGANTKLPSSEHDSANHPLQLYAATKRANELMAHSYSHLYGLPSTGLRFFTVYGPWGRPDMALFEFTRAILSGEPIKIFNQGRHTRDFTYIDDIVEGIIRTSDDIAKSSPNWDGNRPDPAISNAPFRILNIGNGSPVLLSDYIDAIENSTGRKAIRQHFPQQPGDALDTHADVSELIASVGYKPKTNFEEGVRRFVTWYREYYAC